MTANEIIKAFEICRDQDRCNECPYEEDIDCLRRREKHGIELMKRQQEDLASQDETIKNLIEQIKTLRAEIAREIFEEIDKIAIRKVIYQGEIAFDKSLEYEAIKKKHIGGSENE